MAEWERGGPYYERCVGRTDVIMGTQSHASQSSKGGDLLPYVEAVQVLEGRLQTICDTQSLPLSEAVGAILAEQICLDRNEPPVRRSAMDGFALLSDDGTQSREIVGTYFAGTAGQTPLKSGQAVAVMTGGTVPDGADAVIPVERTTRSDHTLQIDIPPVPGQHVRNAGEMGAAGRVIFEPGHRLRVPDIGALAGCGRDVIHVRKKPVVVILSTGDEVVPYATTPEPHQVRDSNRILSKVQLESFGAEVIDHQHLLDEKDALLRGVGHALEQADLVVTIGGVSMGEKDFLPQVFAELGVEKIFHKVDLQPGKPVWVGQKNGRFVLGLPGNPISSYVVLELFGRLIIERLAGGLAHFPRIMRSARLEGDLRSRRRPRFLPGRFTTDPIATVTPIQESGSGDWTSLAGAELLLFLEPSQTLSSGSTIQYLPLECH